MLRRHALLRRVDKGAVRARQEQIDRIVRRELARDRLQLPDEVALSRKITSGMNLLDRQLLPSRVSSTAPAPSLRIVPRAGRAKGSIGGAARSSRHRR